MDLKTKLSPNFTLYEFVRSETAERNPDVQAQQYDPPADVVECLTYLCTKAVQPIREKFNYPMRITSGYRSPKLNSLVGGSSSSQHCYGQAADIVMSEGFLTDTRSAAVRSEVEEQVLKLTGKPVRQGVNANFYLFAYICIHLDELDVDQVIHEYGIGPGEPSWTHVSCSTGRDKRQILAVGKYTSGYEKPDLATALSYGT